MPWLTDLAVACRKSGLKVTEVSGWRTRGHGPMTAVRGIICHHTAGSRSGNYPSLTVVRDGRPGLAGPLAQLGLARDGSVLVIAAGKAWHAGAGSWSGLTGNSDCIGIEAESVGDGKDWTPAQRDAYPRLCRALAQHYGVPASRVIAHKEWAPRRKIDPAGIDMNALRRAVSATNAASRIPDLEDDDMPLNDDDKAWLTKAIREQVWNSAARTSPPSPTRSAPSPRSTATAAATRRPSPKRSGQSSPEARRRPRTHWCRGLRNASPCA